MEFMAYQQVPAAIAEEIEKAKTKKQEK